MRQETPEPRLVADVGGTHLRLGLLPPGKDRPTAIRVLASGDYPSLDAAIEVYLESAPARRPRRAVIAVASAVEGDWISLTNHSWSFSRQALYRRLDLDELVILNDFTALALSIPQLDAETFRQVGGGAPREHAPKAVLGPGTGLGVSGLVWGGRRWVPLEGEGGHACYGGFDAREAQIVEVLRRRFGNVSAERLVSGPGLCNLYQVVCGLAGGTPDSLEPAEIAERGRSGTCEFSVEALGVFCAALGTVAGDLALTLGALGGVYIGGGIIPKLGEYFLESEFRARFEAHGRLSGYLAMIPCYVIHSPYPALIGAAKAFSDSSLQPFRSPQ